MCYNCGCQNPDDNMGNADNITNSTFRHLAGHWKKSQRQTKEEVLKMLTSGKITDSHVSEMFEKAASAWGQSVDEAKNIAKGMLVNELRK